MKPLKILDITWKKLYLIPLPFTEKTELQMKSNFKFLRIKRKDIENEPHWVCCIDTSQQLVAYLEVLAKRNVENYFLAKQCITASPNNPHFGHKGGLGKLQYVMAMELEKYEQRVSIVDDLSIIANVFNKPYIKVFMKTGILYVNMVGGFYSPTFFKDTEQPEILNEMESETFDMPAMLAEDRDKINIIQWQNGTHYYAKIGMVDVVDRQGNQKWDNYHDAQKAAEDFLIRVSYGK